MEPGGPVKASTVVPEGHNKAYRLSVLVMRGDRPVHSPIPDRSFSCNGVSLTS